MAKPRDDRGSAVVEFVFVAPLVVLLALAVLQVALLVHTRAILTAAAADGARAAALAGNDSAAGARRTELMLGRNVGALAHRVSAHRDVIDGLDVMTVRIDAEVGLIGILGWTDMSVEGHALVESFQ